MPNEHFCLKWNNFQRNIVAALGNLKLDEDFVDVTISCEGKLIKAHKVILSACSDYFRDLFRDNPCQHPVIILRDATYTDVEGLVRYVYRGEVDVQPQHLQSFLKTADALKIKGLADQGLMNNANNSASENDLKSEGEESVEDDEDEDLEFERTPSEHSSSTAATANNSSHASLSARLCEPLKVPMPNFRSSGNSETSSSSPEILPPEAKRMKRSEEDLASPISGPLNLSYGSKSNNEPSGPLVTAKAKTNNVSDEDGAYPSTTIDYLESPKHITKVETGVLDDSPLSEAFPRTSGVKKLKKKKKSKVDSTNQLVIETPENNNDQKVVQGGGTNHPRNRWRCMQPRLCNYCWKTFSNSFNLKQHIVNVHIQSQGVSCSLCDKVVKNKWYLRKHLVTAHGAPLKRVNPKTTGKPSENGSEETSGATMEETTTI